MLAKQDLTDITNIVKTIVHSEISDAEVRLNANLESKLQKELKPIKQDIRKIKKNQKTIFNFFDKSYIELRTRVGKLEQAIFP